jgi:hypothetical protein
MDTPRRWNISAHCSPPRSGGRAEWRASVPRSRLRLLLPPKAEAEGSDQHQA